MDAGKACARKFRKWGTAVPLSVGVAGSPSNTVWPGPRATCVPSFILIHPTVRPYTKVTNRTDRTDRQTGQRSDRNGRTVLQAVAQQTAPVSPEIGRRANTWAQNPGSMAPNVPPHPSTPACPENTPDTDPKLPTIRLVAPCPND